MANQQITLLQSLNKTINTQPAKKNLVVMPITNDPYFKNPLTNKFVKNNYTSRYRIKASIDKYNNEKIIPYNQEIDNFNIFYQKFQSIDFKV